ncbi:MAG TPA: arginine--tRNA ligase [Gemmatimonadaceae bacterium]|nr:arginine--tRNA ligase [Gemmatimonadaceae bacterium]
MSSPDALRAEIGRAARELGATDEFVAVVERPRDPSFGEWSTNAAMMLAKPLRQSPRDVAAKLIATMQLDVVGISAAEIAGPGFINFRIDTDALTRVLRAIIERGEAYGRSTVGANAPVVVEFVSANPTGPLHVGHGRQAALGDAISTLLEWTGWKVSREFYYNDGGGQINNLQTSVQLRAQQQGGADIEFPENGYHGDYIGEIAADYRLKNIADAGATDTDSIRRFAVAALRAEQDLDLKAFGVVFDTYFLESSLYTDGRVDRTVAALVASGFTYEKDGALWLRTTDFGDDQDRVMKRSAAKGGEYTYFVPDVAYHVTKWERGFARAINVQGSDHHSTVTRVRAGLQALRMGIPEGYPDYVLHQMVTVMRGGEEVKISKRAGSYVTVRDLIEEVGRDAVRYFFVMRKGDSQLVFDVDLARKQSEENPIYYIQMAHARLCNIFRVGDIDRAAVTGSDTDLSVLVEPEERELIKALADFPSMVGGAAAALEPHRLANWLERTAALVHTWYHKHHVLNEPPAIMQARLVLANATRVVLANALAVLGCSAPERM